jgi:type I restriction enzyme, S subunit
MSHGLSAETVAKIQGVFSRFPSIEKAVLYGSRAKGNYRTGSDIDLTLMGEELSTRQLGDIADQLDDLLLPYTIDLSHFETLNHAKLREHIERVGKLFYQRAEASANIGGAAVKTGWQTKQLANVCQIKPPKAEARQRISGKELVSFVPMEDLGIDQKILVPKQTRLLEDVAGSYTYFADGDVLLAKITPCFENGKLGIAENLTNGIGFGSSEYIVFRPSPAVDKEWLYYFLSRESFRTEGAERMSGAVGHKRVSKEFIESYQIPVPQLPEQRRIVAVLDEAFDGMANAKANTEKNLQNARALFESHLQSVFTERGEGWAEKPLEQVTAIVNGFAFKSGDFSQTGATKCIKITNVGVREFVCESGGGLPAEFSSKYSSVAIPSGSIVIALTRTIISSGLKVAAVPSDYDNALLNQRVAAILPRQGGISLPFLFAYLSSQKVASYVSERVNTLMQPNLSIGDLRSMPIPVPSISQQEKITGLLSSLADETQRLESLYQQKLTALDDLKKSLLHQAFSGAL